MRGPSAFRSTGEDRFPIEFRKGKNTIVVKIKQLSGGWGFFFGVRGLTAPVLYHCPR